MWYDIWPWLTIAWLVSCTFPVPCLAVKTQSFILQSLQWGEDYCITAAKSLNAHVNIFSLAAVAWKFCFWMATWKNRYEESISMDSGGKIRKLASIYQPSLLFFTWWWTEFRGCMEGSRKTLRSQTLQFSSHSCQLNTTLRDFVCLSSQT